MSIGTAIAVVGTVLGAKTAIEGLKEGNLLQAVVGGVGAYFGAASLMSGGAASVAGTAEGAVSASGTATGAAGQQMIKQAGAGMAEQAAATSTMQGMSAGGAAMETGLSNAASQLSGSAGSNLGASMADLGGFAAEQGLASGASMSIPSAASYTADGLGTAASSMNGAAFAPASDLAAFNTANNAAMAGAGQQAGLLGTLKGYGSQAMQWAKENPFMASSAMQLGGGLLQGMSQQDRFDEEAKMMEESRRRRALTGNTSFLSKSRYNPNTGRFEQVA